MAMGILLLGGNGCGKGLFPEASSSASGTGTSSATAQATAFVYASNFNDGNVSAFRRATNGSLTFLAQINAGLSGGPMGLTVTPDNHFLFVVNAADNLVHTFTIQTTGSALGTLTSLNTTVTGITPQMILVDSTESFAYVTNAGSRSISQYTVNDKGSVTSNGTVTGFAGGTPFGIIENVANSVVYVSDSTAGLIYTFTIGSIGQLTPLGTAISSNGSTGGQPALMAIAADSSQSYLLADDTLSGFVSVFLINSDGSLSFSNLFGTGQSKPIGIGAVTNGGTDYVFRANMTGNFVQPFTRSAATLAQQPFMVPDSFGPTGLIIDPSGLFVYTANSGSGTIAQLDINNAKCNGQPVCVVNAFNSESPKNSNAGTQFLAITN